MGACESNNCSSKRLRRKSFNKKVDYKSMDTEIPMIDESSKELPEILKQIEDLRSRFSLMWNEFLCISGAIVLSNPTIKSCITGYLFRLSCDLREQDIKSIQLELSPPRFIIEQDYMLTKGAKAYIKEIEIFIQFAGNIAEEAQDLYSRFKSQSEIAEQKIEEYKKSIVEMNPDEKKKVFIKLNRKTEILKHTDETITVIRNTVKNTDSDLVLIQEELKTQEFIDLLLKVEKEECGKAKVDSLAIMWKFSKEEKLESLTEGRAREKEGVLNKHEIQRVNTQ